MNRPIFGWHRLISSQFAHAKHDRRHHFDDPSCQIKRVPIWFWRCDGFCFRTFFLLYVHQWDILVNWRNTIVGAIYSLICVNRETELNCSSNVDETTRENVGADERCPADVSSTPISIHINGTHSALITRQGRVDAHSAHFPHVFLHKTKTRSSLDYDVGRHQYTTTAKTGNGDWTMNISNYVPLHGHYHFHYLCICIELQWWHDSEGSSSACGLTTTSTTDEHVIMWKDM